MKKSISPLIATVLIVGFTIVLTALVMMWALPLFEISKYDIKTYGENCNEGNKVFLIENYPNTAKLIEDLTKCSYNCKYKEYNKTKVLDCY